jgi:hypothetical protein
MATKEQGSSTAQPDNPDKNDKDNLRGAGGQGQGSAGTHAGKSSAAGER